MIKGMQRAARVIWWGWFYFLVALPILVFAPALLVLTFSERTYPQFFWLARNLWASFILYGMGCPPDIRYAQPLVPGRSYMLVANHSSMLDIMLMLRASPRPFVFVGKKELARIPVFGFFYRRVCIMVDRDDPRSRSGVYRRARQRLQGGLSICIFPEGGVPEEDIVLDRFKDGAFKLAIAHGLPLVPMVFYDCKRRFPFHLESGSPGRLRVQVHPFIETAALKESDAVTLRNRTRERILRSLEEGPGF